MRIRRTSPPPDQVKFETCHRISALSLRHYYWTNAMIVRAEKLYRKAIAEGDHVSDAYCNLGIIESKAGRTAKAFDCFTKALEYDSRHFEAHYNLGNLYFEADNLRLAKMHYELAAEIRSDFPSLHFNIGLVLALMGERKAAITAFDKYRLMSPEDDHRTVDNLICKLNKS